MRIAIFYFCVVAIPQGLGCLLHDSQSFAVLELGLRILDGFGTGAVETCSATIVFRLFKRKSELTAANGILMGVRVLTPMASGVLGGALYAALGMIGPYTVIGIVATLIAYTQRLMLPTVDDGKVHTNAPILSLLRSWHFCGLLFALFVQFLLMAMLEILWQPWVGLSDAGDYGWKPVKLSTLSTSMLAGSAFAMVMAMLLIPIIGNVWTAASGISVVSVALLLVGNKVSPPYVFPFIGVVPWLPYVLAVAMGIGFGTYFVTVPSLTLEVLHNECGISRVATDGPLAAIMVFSQAFAIFVGPILGGFAVSTLSVAGMCIIAFSIEIVALVIFLLSACKYASNKDMIDA